MFVCKVPQLCTKMHNMFICKVLFFCTFHLTSFLPPSSPLPPLFNARLTTTHIALPPSPPRTTPHNTTHTLHNVAQREHTPLALGSAVATLRTTEHLPHDKQHLQATSPQLTTTLHTVAQRSQIGRAHV